VKNSFLHFKEDATQKESYRKNTKLSDCGDGYQVPSKVANGFPTKSNITGKAFVLLSLLN
jgi:hypothetical protein